MKATSVALGLAALAALGCGTGGGPPEAEGCEGWTESTTRAWGSFRADPDEGGFPQGGEEWIFGVDAAVDTSGVHLLTTSACVVDFGERPEPATPDDRWVPYDAWFATAGWRLAGPVSEPLAVPGAVLVGVPGMTGGAARRAMDCSGEPTTGCFPYNLDEWLFLQDGVAEITVGAYTPDARCEADGGDALALAEGGAVPCGHLDARGWVAADEPDGRVVELDLDLVWAR